MARQIKKTGEPHFGFPTGCLLYLSQTGRKTHLKEAADNEEEPVLREIINLRLCKRIACRQTLPNHWIYVS